MKLFLFTLFLLGFQIFGHDPEIENKLKEYIQFSQTEENSVGHIYIGGHDSHISQGTYIYVKKALDKFKELRPSFIILELDTPGGELFASQKISDALKEIDIQYGIPVVAFINNWAMSGGALLGYSCRFISVVKDGSMGAAQPISSSGETGSEKINSAVRTDFGARSAFFDRNPLIAEAMVDPDIILAMRGGKVVKLANETEFQKGDSFLKQKGKLLTLSSEEMIALEVADIRLMPTKIEPLTNKEKEEGTWPASKALLFTAPFFRDIPNVTIHSFKMDWKTRFFSILSSPMIHSLLFLGLILFFYTELSTPGFGLPGILGIFCLFLIILSSFATQAAALLELIFLALGILMILLEVFFLPSFGIIGILGAAVAFIGLITLLLPGIGKVQFDFDTKTFNAAGGYVLERASWLGGALIVGFIIMAFLAKSLVPKLRLISPLVLKESRNRVEPSNEILPSIDSEGVVLSPLRCAGKIEIQGEVFDAVSSGNFIDQGARIKVIKIEGQKIIVEDITC